MIRSNPTNIPTNWLVWAWDWDWNWLDRSWNWNNGTATNVTYTSADRWYVKEVGSFNGSSSKINIWANLFTWTEFSTHIFIKLNSLPTTWNKYIIYSHRVDFWNWVALYISNNKWNGDFDGSMLQMTVDENLPRFVRIGIKDEKVFFFEKKAFLNHLENQDLSNVEKAEKEWQASKDYSDEYDYFIAACEPLISSFKKIDGITLYINSIDFLRDIAVPILGEIKWN